MRVRPLWAVALALGACVTSPGGAHEQDSDLARTVVVPLPATVMPSEAPLLEFYQGLLERLHGAYQDRRLDELQQLLASYRRADAPDWAQASMDSFVAAALGMQFELHCDQHAQLLVTRPDAPLGSAIGMQLQLMPMSEHTVVLDRTGGGEPTVIGLRFSVEDTLLDGASRQQTVSDSLYLPADVALAPGKPPLVLPFELGADVSAAMRRRITVTVSLMPGYVQVDGQKVPVRRTALATATLVQYPAGSEAIRMQPLQSLRGAMALGDPAHFPHVLLAAMFAGAGERQAVQELLVSWVRLGTDDQALVAMAGLKELTGQPIAVGDRQRWLQWWQEHR